MSDPNTVKILNIIGGGQRGHLPNEWLDLLFGRWGINKTEVWKHFDIICGASIGGIIGAALAYGYSPADIRPFFTEQGKRLFTIRTVPIGCDADSDSNTPNLAQKAALLALSDPFYKSPCAPDAGNSNFGDNILQSSLVQKFGDATMQALKTNVIIPSVRSNLKQFVMFSNYNNPFYIGQNEKIRDVLRATSAAPIYLPEYTFGGNVHDDGGLFANNVTLEAYQFAKIRFPKANRFCVVSAGTGRGQYTFDPAQTPTDAPQSLATKAASLLGQTMDGQSESVDRAFKIKSSPYTLDQVYYLTFNPALDSSLDTALDNTKPAFLSYLTNLAQTSFNNDLANIDEFITRINT